MQPPVNGTDERLDLLIKEIQALRLAIEGTKPAPPPDSLVKLSEPAKRGRPPRGR